MQHPKVMVSTLKVAAFASLILATWGWMGDYNGTIKGRITPNPTTQLFTIDSSGTATIRKYNHEIRRAINNDVWLDDVLQDN